MNLFDLHCDMPTAVFKGLKTAVSFPQKIQKQVQTCAVFVRDDTLAPYDYYKAVLEKFKSNMAYPANDLKAEKSIILSVEGGAVLEGNADRVWELFSDGISELSLVWNGETELAGGVNSEKGLTDCGKKIICEMNKAGMVLDLSHLNDKSFYSAVQMADFAIASHSNFRSICQSKRNLTEEQLKIIGQKGGLVGINFYPLFLGEGDPFLRVYNHIEYMLEKGFEDCISIGSDFDGAEMSDLLDSTEKTLSLYDFLNQKGIKTGVLDKIFYQNALNFFKNVFDKRHKIV